MHRNSSQSRGLQENLCRGPLSLVSRKHNMAIVHLIEKQTDQCLVFPTVVWLVKIGPDAASIQYCHEIV